MITPPKLNNEQRHAWKAFYCAWLRVMAERKLFNESAQDWHDEACAWADDCIKELALRSPPPKGRQH